MDAGIKFPPANSSLGSWSPLDILSLGQNIASYASPTAMPEFFKCSLFKAWSRSEYNSYASPAAMPDALL